MMSYTVYKHFSADRHIKKILNDGQVAAIIILNYQTIKIILTIFYWL